MLALINGEYVVAEEQTIDIPETLPTYEETLPTYEEKVVSLIREKYSVDDELAIQRQRDTKPEEFQEYYNYCEECKEIAKGACS